MKKKSIVLLVVAFLSFLAIPFKTNAATPVTIYFFRGEGCGYCAAAESFFDSLKEDDEYKDLFVVKDFEVWKNQDNADFAEEVADKMGDSLGGVPYIIIGDETWTGYTDTYDDAIKAQIKEIAADDNYVDPLAEMVANYEANIPEEDNNSLISIALLVGVVAVIGIGLYFARRGVESETDVKEEKKKETTSEKKEAPVVEEPQEEKEEEKVAEKKKEEKITEKTEEPKKETPKKTSTKSTTTKKKGTKTTSKTNNKKTTNSKTTTKKTTTKKTTK